MDNLDQNGFKALSQFQQDFPQYYNQLVSTIQQSATLTQDVNNYGATIGQINIVQGTKMSTVVSSTNGVPLGQIQVGTDTFSSSFGGISSGPLTFGSQLAHELANSSTAAAGTLAVSGLFGQTNSSPQDFAAAAIAVDGGSAVHDYAVATELSAQSGVPVGSFLTSVPPTLKATFDSLAQQYGIGSDQFQQAASAAGVTYYGQPSTSGISTNTNLSLTNYYMAEYVVEIAGVNAFDLSNQINNSNVTVQGSVVTVSGIPVVLGESVTHDTISISKTSESAVVCTSTQDESGNITAQVKVQTPSTDLASVPALNLENLIAVPTINSDQTLAVPTSAGTYHIDAATGDIADTGAVTTPLINGQTVTLLGLGGSSPFAVASSGGAITAGALTSNAAGSYSDTSGNSYFVRKRRPDPIFRSFPAHVRFPPSTTESAHG